MQGRRVVVVVMVNNKLPLIKVRRGDKGQNLGKVTSSFGDLEDGPAWAVVTWSLSPRVGCRGSWFESREKTLILVLVKTHPQTDLCF